MSVSRCLGPALTALGGQNRSEWKTYIDDLPVACPHADCSNPVGCRPLVAEYFRMQWHIRVALERRKQRQHAVGMTNHG